ncbi:MAG: ABC transporter permease [Nocardiopsis sp. BM-2018]|nr:MAG: ABC transporter permease [Nocardiopsis sp. BM-2018]
MSRSAAPDSDADHVPVPVRLPEPGIEPARTFAAELVKLVTLPAARATVLGTIAVSAGMAALTADPEHGPADAASTVFGLIVFLQVGTVLLGVLTTASEYAGGQIRTTLAATPRRGVLLAAKSAACLMVSALTGAVAVGTALTSAWLVTEGSLLGGASPWRLVGAAVYLSLLGLLAHLVAVVARALLPPLVGVLALVLIVSPLLGGLTEHARWLPDRAGQPLYLPGADTVFTPWTGPLVLCGWLLAVGAVAALLFTHRDV